jgi:Xaa-Pro aminopeptidase
MNIRAISGKKLTAGILLIGEPSTDANLFYACRFSASDPVVFFGEPGRGWLVTPAMEHSRASRDTSDEIEVMTPEQLKLPLKSRRDVGAWAVELIKMLKLRSVAIPPLFPFDFARRLEKAGIRVSVVKGQVFPQRVIKTRDEIMKLRESQKAAAAAMSAAIDAIAAAEVKGDTLRDRKGTLLTSEAVREAIDLELLRHDCLAPETIVSCGPDSADPHERGEGPLRPHQPIVIDIFPRHRAHGYWGDLTRTVVKGEPPARLRKMHAAVNGAQSLALRMLRAGVNSGDIHAAIVDFFNQRGFRTGNESGYLEGFIHSTGHGVGLNIHEAPSLRPLGDRMEAGHVVTIEPGLYYRDIGGVRIEDTVAVTKDGYEYLAKARKAFRI